MASPIEMQNSGHRILTPPRFAAWLCERVRAETGSTRIAALYVALYGPYPRIADVECWPIRAQDYPGPWPVVCHPPCGPWGPVRTLCKYQTKEGGLHAIEMVHRYGGVIEQPEASTLLRLHGREGARLELVRQGDWGHPLPKKTWLYWYFPVRLRAGMGIG